MESHTLVSVALTTYNGENYLREQLSSIYSQTYKSIEVVVTDDCSIDSTIQILQEYHKKYGLRYYINESNLGFLKNFEKAISLCEGNYIALCDQDDVWLPNKIELEMHTLLQTEDRVGSHIPVLVFSDLYIVDSNLDVVANSAYGSPNFDPHKTSYNHLLVQNVVIGCTALFNQALRKAALPMPDGSTYHDHWLAIVSSIFGEVQFLDQKTVYYRQHTANCVGAGRSGQKESYPVLKLLRRVLRLFLLPLNDQRFSLTFEYQFRLAREVAKIEDIPKDVYEVCVFWGDLHNVDGFRRKYELIRKGLLRHTLLDKIEMLIKL